MQNKTSTFKEKIESQNTNKNFSVDTLSGGGNSTLIRGKGIRCVFENYNLDDVRQSLKAPSNNTNGYATDVVSIDIKMPSKMNEPYEYFNLGLSLTNPAHKSFYGIDKSSDLYQSLMDAIPADVYKDAVIKYLEHQLEYEEYQLQGIANNVKIAPQFKTDAIGSGIIKVTSLKEILATMK